MIFRVISIYKNVKEGRKDPTGFGRDQLVDMVKGFVVPFIVVGILILTLFALIGFSNILGIGPFGFFRVIFVLGLLVFVGWLFVLRIVFSSLKKVLNKAKDRVDSQVFHHDVTPK
jgi:pilus assembly protein TadC